jgi:hypothetical protein
MINVGLRSLLGSLLTLVFMVVASATSAFASDAAAGADAEDAVAAPVKVTPELIQVAASYQSGFKNIASYLDELVTLGDLTEEEQDGISTFLKSQKVDLEAPMKLAKVVGSTVSFGTKSLTWGADGSLKTQSGRIVHHTAGAPADKNFIETYRALQATSVGFDMSRLFFPYANAEGRYNDDYYDRLCREYPSRCRDGDGNPILDLLELGVSIPAHVIAGVGCGILGAPARWELENMRSSRRVVCASDGSYRLTGYRRYDAYTRAERHEEVMDAPGSDRIIGGMNADVDEMCNPGEAVDGVAGTLKIRQKVLSNAFSEGGVPRCTGENAQVVARYFAEHGRALADDVVAKKKKKKHKKRKPKPAAADAVSE